MAWLCWHRWTKWEPYLWQGKVQFPILNTGWQEASESRQKRRCEKCGMSQDEKVRGS